MHFHKSDFTIINKFSSPKSSPNEKKKEYVC